VLGRGSVCVGFAEPGHVFEGTQERYERLVSALRSAFTAVGVHAEQGELRDEWCPGSWSLHSGPVKLAGLAQRVIKGAAWTDAVVTFAPDPDSADLLTDVYAALELPLDQATVGSLSEVAGRELEFDELAQPLLAALLG
jgi:octanoyl-[GcvH]:protein N-octanoyltransferase